ncbi:MAG: ABC transporter permease [Acidobacteriota bacterium]
MNRRRLRAVARKEFLHILRDPRSLIMALALPLVMLALFGWALTLDVDRIPLAVLDLSRTGESRELVSRFEGSRFFTIEAVVSNYAELENLLDRSVCLAALVIPPDFARDLGRGHDAQAQFILDGSDSNTASIAFGYAQALFGAYIRGQLEGIVRSRVGFMPEQPLRLEARVRYNPRLLSKNYIVPGLVAVILMIIASLLTSLTIAREWEMGTMELLLSTPVRPAELVLGKMGAYLVLGGVDTILAVGFGVVVFQVPMKGSVILAAVSCFVFLCGALCWGILLSALVRNQLLAYQLGMLSSFLPAFLLSGFIFAVENMPLPVRLFSNLIPATHFIALLRGIFLKGVGLEVVGGALLLLSAFASAVFAVATRRLKGKIS